MKQTGTRYTYRWWLKSQADQLISMGIVDSKGTKTILQVEKTLKPGDWQLWASDFVAALSVKVMVMTSKWQNRESQCKQT